MRRIGTLKDTFNAGDIIGKTLKAKKNIKIKLFPSDSSKVVRTVKAGDIVGVVDTFLMPKEGRSKLYWVFKDEKNKSYFAEHNKGDYDLKGLKSQGTKSDEQKAKEEKEEEEGIIITTIKEYGGYIIGLVAVGFVIKLAVTTATKK